MVSSISEVEVSDDYVCGVSVLGHDRNVMAEKPPFATVPVQHSVTAGILSPGDHKPDHRESQERAVVGMNITNIIAEPDRLIGLVDSEQAAPRWGQPDKTALRLPLPKPHVRRLKRQCVPVFDA